MKSAFVALVAIVLSSAFGWKSALSAQEPTPQALIIAFEDYQGRELKIEDTFLLMERLHENGYGLTFVSNQGTIQKVHDWSQERIPIQCTQASDKTQIENQIEKWQSKYFSPPNRKHPFGFVFFYGHGSHINDTFKKDVLELPGHPISNGLCIQDVRQQFSEKRLPVALFVDMCRIPTTPITIAQQIENIASEQGDQPKHVSAGYDVTTSRKLAVNRRAQVSNSPILTFWSSTLSNEATISGFLPKLAEGLERKGRNFKAYTESRVGSIDPYVPKERFTDLNLYTWYNYAKNELMEKSAQETTFDSGSLDLSMVCASTDPKFVYTPPTLNLLPTWSNFAATDLECNAIDGVRVFTKNKSSGNFLGTAFFEAGELDWQGKYLIVEAYATRGSDTVSNGVKALLGPGDNRIVGTAANNYNSLNPNLREPYFIPYDGIRRFVIPLAGNKDQAFTSMTITPYQNEWALGASVTITKLLLSDSEFERPGIKASIPDQKRLELLPRWWAHEPIRDTEDWQAQDKDQDQDKTGTRIDLKSNYGKASKSASPKLTLTFTSNESTDTVGMGGGLAYEPLIGTEIAELLVEVDSVTSTSKDAFLNIDFRDREDHLLAQGAIQCVSNKKLYRIPIQKSGLLNYIAISGRGVQQVVVSKISLVAIKRSKR